MHFNNMTSPISITKLRYLIITIVFILTLSGCAFLEPSVSESKEPTPSASIAPTPSATLSEHIDEPLSSSSYDEPYTDTSLSYDVTVSDNSDISFYNDTHTDSLEIHFIDVGQGDATLIKCNEHYLLVDAGDNSMGTAVQLYLTKQGVSSLDAVIWTHPDADHIGGADVITTKFDIGSTYMPDIASDTATYRDLMSAIKAKNIKPIHPGLNDSFFLGTAKITFIGPIFSYEDTNNNSLVCLIEFMDFKILLPGDAERPSEEAISNYYGAVDVDIYKAGHHGSSTASSMPFIQNITPEFAVISCSKDNSYGHPHAETLNTYRTLGVNVFRTDEQGSIVAYIDNSGISWNSSPSLSWKPGDSPNNESSTPSYIELDIKPNESTDEPGITYIGNANNMKLHRADCSYGPQPQNQVPFNTKQEAFSAGYTDPCKICNP